MFVMFKVSIRNWSLVAAALFLLASSSAQAAPMLYAIDSGSAVLTVTLDDGFSTNVKTGGGVVNITLDTGSFVNFDPTASAFGTLVSLSLFDAGPIFIDLDQALAALDTVTIVNAMLNDTGTPAARTGGGSFSIPTLMSGTVSGVFPDTSTFGPVPLPSSGSLATGSLGLSPGQLMLGIFGVNIATFPQTANPGAPDIIVKADFTFVGSLVPEPGTALLLGLGLIGLGTSKPRR